MPPSPLLKRHGDIILFLQRLNPRQRAKFISSLSKTHIDTISELFSNFLRGNLTRDPRVVKKVKKFGKEIKAVACKRTGVKSKKHILSKPKGGAILSVLLPLAASLISGLVAR